MSERGSYLDIMLSSLSNFPLADYVIDILVSVLIGVLVVIISGVLIGVYNQKRRSREESKRRRWVNFVWAKDWSINTILSRNEEYIRIKNRKKRRNTLVFVSLCLLVVAMAFWIKNSG